MLENGVPIRPVGFCNVNEMFEINTEQADSIEVLRGPSNSLYGSSAVHGAVNVLQAAPADRSKLRGGVDAGPDQYRRIKLAARALGDRTSAGVAALYAHDGGWRASSGFDEGKLNATLATSVRDAPLRVDFAGTVLDPAASSPAKTRTATRH
jgi:iron complex outermembrane recepter protein